jgi:hypothetical protein
MKDFSHDIESRLDKVYKSGTIGKYGYSSVTNFNNYNSDDQLKDSEAKKLNRMA